MTEVPFVERDRGKDERHGTLSGALRHSKAGEPPCDACRAAKTAYDKSYRAAEEQTRKSRMHARAQGRANTALRKAHPEEYRALYLAAKAESMNEEKEILND